MSDLEPSLPERAVARLAATLDRSRPSRRSFFAKAAITGSALAIKPWTFLIQDAAAYDVVCGAENECADGWTAFCCTVSGSNSCPPGSFPAGWWKADASGFCCGSARYYIDCNQSCGDQTWQCHCASGTCDRRRVACNQFRYGQCHQEIACYGPVVCRVITCQPPWQWDPTCTTSSATDNRTASHSAPCLDEYCWTSVEALWTSLGGAGGVLGNRLSTQQEIAPVGVRTLFEHGAIFQWNSNIQEVHGPIWSLYSFLGAQNGVLQYPTSNTMPAAAGGLYGTFQGGVIFWSPSTGAHEVRGAILTEWNALNREVGPLGYPTSGQRTASRGGATYNDFERGSIYAIPGVGTFTVRDAIFTEWNALGRETSVLGLPRSDTMPATRGATFTTFESGVIYSAPGVGTHEVHGAILTVWDQTGREQGPLGFPTSDQRQATRGGVYNSFENGAVYAAWGAGTHEVHGAVFAHWDALGREQGPLGFPASNTLSTRDGGTCNTFESGAICSVPGLGTHEVQGAIFAKWNALGRERGPLGYPIADTQIGAFGERISVFEHGRISFDRATGRVTVEQEAIT